MRLNFKKTYNNVQFHKLSQKCLSYDEKEEFINEVKNIPNMTIISVSEDHSKEYRTPFDCGFLVEIIGFYSETDDLFDYEFIDNFFEEQYPRLDKVLDQVKTPVLEFTAIWCRNNGRFKNIEALYSKLNERKEGTFESFSHEIKTLELFDLSLNELDSLSDDNLGKLMRYNKIVSTFKSKFEAVEKEMGEKLGFGKGGEDEEQ